MQTLLSTRNRILVISLFLIVCATAWRFFVPHERVYRGWPISVWVRPLSITPLGQTNAALDTLLAIGPDCLPALAAELKVGNNLFSSAWQKVWPKLPVRLRKVLPPPVSRATRRAIAAWALGQIGPAARPVAPALVKALDDPDDQVRANAAEALRWVRPKSSEVVAALARRLSDPTPMVRSCASGALWDMAPQSRAAVPALIQLLYDPDLASMGAICLQELGPLASNAVPHLIEVVKQGVAGPLPRKAFSARARDQKDPSAHNRAMAAKALGRIGFATADVVDTLEAALKYPPSLEGTPERMSSWVCQNAAQALGRLGTNAASAVPALIEALGHTNPPALEEVALALGAMGAQARSALPWLGSLLSELPEPFARRAGIGEDRKWEMFWLKGAVARAISQLEPSNEIALTVLFEMADGDYAGRRRLAELGNTAKGLVPKISEQLAKADGQPQVAKAELLWHLDPQNPAIIPALARGMNHTNSAVRAHAAYWYWRVTGNADVALNVIVAGLEEPASPASQGFPQWLGQMGAAACPAIPALKKALWHYDIFTRRNAAKALEKIDPAARGVP